MTDLQARHFSRLCPSLSFCFPSRSFCFDSPILLFSQRFFAAPSRLALSPIPPRYQMLIGFSLAKKQKQKVPELLSTPAIEPRGYHAPPVQTMMQRIMQSRDFGGLLIFTLVFLILAVLLPPLLRLDFKSSLYCYIGLSLPLSLNFWFNRARN